MAIGARLRMARESAGLSQGQAAKLMGMHRPTVSEIEAGRRRLAADELARFATTYGIGVAWLVGAQDDVTDDVSDRVKLAARQLGGLKDEDLDKLMRLLQSMRGATG
ncbi:MAG: helix-turn-helix transcriptional regulator [Planctomycetes bacterium]|nr:helix-turn-helix transcriptional regulator [Planctomycetota bacterium]